MEGIIMRYRYFALALIVVAIIISGCSDSAIRDKVEKSVAESLPEYIGPAESYTVKASGPTLPMMQGKLNKLDIIGINVQMPNGMRVARLNVVIPDISFDVNKKTLKRAGITEYTASISESELTRYIAEKYSKIPNLSVSLSDGNIGLFAKPGIYKLRLAVQGNADLIVRKDHILALDLKKLNVGGIAMPSFAVGLLESQLGTIFDAKDLGFDAKIKSTTIGPGTLTLNGTLDLMKMMEKKKDKKSKY